MQLMTKRAGKPSMEVKLGSSILVTEENGLFSIKFKESNNM